MNVFDFLKRLVTIPKSSRVAVQHVISAEIDSIYAHNPPDQIAGKIAGWLTSTPLGSSALGSLAIAAVLPSVTDIISKNETEAGKEKLKAWIYGRLGVN